MTTMAQWERIIARQRLTRKDLLVVGIFARSHPEQSLTRAVYEFLRGRGPAAVARGRAGHDTIIRPVWRPSIISDGAKTTASNDFDIIWAEISPAASVTSTPAPLAAIR